MSQKRSEAFFRCFSVVVAAFLCAAASSAGAMEEAAKPTAVPGPKGVGTAYCGLHCVYAAIRTKVLDAEFDRLLNTGFINGQFGSTESNLIDAFAEYRVSAIYSPSLSIESLKGVTGPVILHVRPVGRRVYSHWILFLGFDGERIRVFDPPHQEELLSATDLLSVWNGGVVIPEFSSTNEGSLDGGAFLAHVSASASLVVMILICVATLNSLNRNRTFVSFIIASLMVGVFSHVMLETGFLYGRFSIGGIQASYFPVTLQEVDTAHVQRLIGKSDVFVVDARTQEAFERFHLPGAINIPIDSTLGQLGNEIPRLRDAKEVIIYCQSEGCRWADTVGNQIVNRGITNVSIYRGGVNDWRQESAP